jgi:ATP-dependent DNA helicase RecQ
VLSQYWGHDTFRAGQQEAIASVLEGVDTLVLFPTGAGKSLCYQVPAMVLGGLTLVISPLVALMEDQVSQLNQRGIKATCIHRGLRRAEVEQRVNNARNGLYRLLYLAPERLKTSLFQHELGHMDIRLVAVDEAHCISEWGHDFRPSYRHIRSSMRQVGYQGPWLALTATATPRVRNDILKVLELEHAPTISQSVRRSNLKWWVLFAHKKWEKLLQVLSKTTGSGLVYVATRKEAEQLASKLQQRGILAAAYHAGMSTQERQQVQAQWIRDEVPVVVATNAFGMGIDKPNCRFVVHWSPPGSLEAYYQEAGRAGRDGLLSYPILLWNQADLDRLQKQLEQSYPPFNILNHVYGTLCDQLNLAMGHLQQEAGVLSWQALSRRSALSETVLASALRLLELHEVIEWDQDPQETFGVHLIGPWNRLSKPTEGKQALKDAFGDQLARLFGVEALESMRYLELALLQDKMKLTRNALLKGLEVFKKDGLIQYELRQPGLVVKLTDARLPSVPVVKSAYETYRGHQLEKLQRMQGYLETSDCRSRYFSLYFGDTNSHEPCGLCDRCSSSKIPKNTPTQQAEVQTLLHLLQQHSELPLEQLKSELGWTTPHLHRVLGWMEKEGWITLRGTTIVRNSP